MFWDVFYVAYKTFMLGTHFVCEIFPVNAADERKTNERTHRRRKSVFYMLL